MQLNIETKTHQTKPKLTKLKLTILKTNKYP